MIYAPIHLMINHIPVIALPLNLLFLVFSVYKKNKQMKKFSLLILIFIGLTILPVYFTGEPAEHEIEDFPAVNEAVIHPHEEMAEKTLAILLLTSVTALATLAFERNEKLNRQLTYTTIGLAIIGSMSLIYTASLGGKIRHTETRALKI